eukprot:9501826-Pyramimonas_sp.AAC.1
MCVAACVAQFGKEGARLLVLRNLVNEFQGFITRTFTSDQDALQSWLDSSMAGFCRISRTNVVDGDDDDDDDDDFENDVNQAE